MRGWGIGDMRLRPNEWHAVMEGEAMGYFTILLSMVGVC